MDIYKQIYLIILGAAIGFISSIGTIIVGELLKFRGQVKLFYKIVYSKVSDKKTWGFYKTADGLKFEVPIWIEIQNTSNVTHIVRDLNIILFNKGKEILQMIQINKTDKGFFGNEGAYSFVIQPRSIVKYDFHFLIKKSDMGEKTQFDEICLRYYDEKERIHLYTLKRIEHCWELGELERTNNWQLARK